MLQFITALPEDKPIAGVHCIPVLEDGNIVMVWDREERGLTTIGGRIEGDETLQEALDREALEEAGLILGWDRQPFACWYWENTDTYTVWFLVRGVQFGEMTPGFEKTGYVIMNIETALQMITRLEGEGDRTSILRRAGMLSGQPD